MAEAWEALSKVAAGFLAALPALAPVAPAAPVAAAPAPVVATAAALANPQSLGLKLLLEPNTSSYFFRASW